MLSKLVRHAAPTRGLAAQIHVRAITTEAQRLNASLQDVDPEVFGIIEQEKNRFRLIYSFVYMVVCSTGAAARQTISIANAPF